MQQGQSEDDVGCRYPHPAISSPNRVQLAGTRGTNPAVILVRIPFVRRPMCEWPEVRAKREGTIRRYLILVLGAVLAIAMLAQAPAASSAERKVLQFDTMAPVTGPFVGSANPIRNINGGGLPWKIDEGKGKLTSGGDVDVRVRGLVLLDGENPVPFFQATVSCLSIEGDQVTTVNVATAPFPASTSGDSHIKDTVVLPTPCVAPILFVGPNATTWFAATGQ